MPKHWKNSLQQALNAVLLLS